MGPNQVYHCGLSVRDGFIIPGITACDCKSAVTFSVSRLLSYSLSITLFSLSLSSAGGCSAKSLGSLAGISMNQSLLSSHIYEAVSEAKPQRLMRLMWVSSDAAGKTHSPLCWRSASATLESWSLDFIYYCAIIKGSTFSAWHRVLFTRWKTINVWKEEVELKRKWAQEGQKVKVRNSQVRWITVGLDSSLWDWIAPVQHHIPFHTCQVI